MSRKPEYNINSVFERAIPLMLAQGFRGCTMDTLINATCFNRRAFYVEFGNKQGFVNALLNHYIEQHLLPLQKTLFVNEHIPKAIVDYFAAYQAHINQQGCLLVRLILELGKENPEVILLARRYFDNLQLIFISCLEKAIANKELPNDLNAEALALKLCCFAQGFAVSNSLVQGDADALIVIESLFSNNA